MKKRGQIKARIKHSFIHSSKRGQMKLSFGMIFSIILIIIFVSFAFFAVKKFLEIGNTAQVAKFADTIQNDIDKAWKGSQSMQTKEYYLPKEIEYLCFIDYSRYPTGKRGRYAEFYDELIKVFQEYETMFFYPIGSSQGLESKQIKHIDLEKITSLHNPFCVANKEGKVKLTLEKEYGDALVIIKE